MAIIEKIKQGTKYVAYITLVTGASIQTVKLLQKEDGTIDLPTTLPLPESLVVEKAPEQKTIEINELPEIKIEQQTIHELPSLQIDETVDIGEVIRQSITSMDEYFESHKSDTIEVVTEVKEKVQDIVAQVKTKDTSKKIKKMMDHSKKHHKSKKYCVTIKYEPQSDVGDLIRNKLMGNS